MYVALVFLPEVVISPSPLKRSLQTKRFCFIWRTSLVPATLAGGPVQGVGVNLRLSEASKPAPEI